MIQPHVEILPNAQFGRALGVPFAYVTTKIPDVLACGT
jgi:hypothetical protein